MSKQEVFALCGKGEIPKAAGLISQQINELKLVKSDSSGQIHHKLDVIGDLIGSLDLVKTEFSTTKNLRFRQFWDQALDSLNKYQHETHTRLDQ